MTDQSLWEITKRYSFMADEGRDQHASRQVCIDYACVALQGSEPTILDVGVLSAQTYPALAASLQGLQYTGVDVNQATLSAAEHAYPDANWVLCAVQDLPFGTHEFSVVHCRHVLEHLPHYECAIREMSRVASQMMILCFFIPPADQEVLRRKVGSDGYVWVNTYSERPMLDLLESLWGKVISVDVTEPKRPNRVYICTAKRTSPTFQETARTGSRDVAL